MTLYEQIEEILQKVDKLDNLKKKTIITYYQHKTNKADIFTKLTDAFDRGLNLAEYDKIEKTESLKPTLKKEIFGSEDFVIKKDTAYRFQFLFFIVQELSRKPRKPRTPKNKTEKKTEKKV